MDTVTQHMDVSFRKRCG